MMNQRTVNMSKSVGKNPKRKTHLHTRKQHARAVRRNHWLRKRARRPSPRSWYYALGSLRLRGGALFATAGASAIRGGRDARSGVMRGARR